MRETEGPLRGSSPNKIRWIQIPPPPAQSLPSHRQPSPHTRPVSIQMGWFLVFFVFVFFGGVVVLFEFFWLGKAKTKPGGVSQASEWLSFWLSMASVLLCGFSHLKPQKRVPSKTLDTPQDAKWPL